MGREGTVRQDKRRGGKGREEKVREWKEGAGRGRRRKKENVRGREGERKRGHVPSLLYENPKGAPSVCAPTTYPLL